MDDPPDAAAAPANDADEEQVQAQGDLGDTSKPPKRVKLDLAPEETEDAEPIGDADADNGDVEEVNAVADGDGAEEGDTTVVIDMTSDEWDNIDDFDLDDYDFDEWQDPGSDVGQAEPKPKKDDSEFTVLTVDQIYAHMDEVVTEVSSVLRFKPHVCRTLLNAFNWKKDKLLEAYYENDERFAHLFKVAKVSPFPSDPLVPDPNMIIECSICLNEQKHKHTHALDCGHRFCNTCWEDHITNKIKNEGNAHTIFCPSTKCNTIVDHDTVAKLISDPAVLEKYKSLLVMNFVQSSETMSWCLSPTSCTFGIRVETLEAKRVTCTCGYSFCFGCKKEWHDPITCALLTQWLKKCSDDSETAKWIQTHTKDCPKCSVQIEKNGGCNHMTCRNKSCRHEFCWLCMENWPHQAGYQCNRYVERDEGGQVQEDAGKNKARTSLKRYIFYSKFHEIQIIPYNYNHNYNHLI